MFVFTNKDIDVASQTVFINYSLIVKPNMNIRPLSCLSVELRGLSLPIILRFVRRPFD